MNIRRLTFALLAALVLSPLSPALRAQEAAPTSSPTYAPPPDRPPPPDSSLEAYNPPLGPSDSPSFAGVPDRNGHLPGAAAPSPPAPLRPPTTFTGVITELAARHPFGFAGRPPDAAADSLPVSDQELILTIGGTEQIEGRIEARIATVRGLYYAVPTPRGTQIVRAASVTSVRRADGGPLGSLALINPPAHRLAAGAARPSPSASAYPVWTGGHGARSAFKPFSRTSGRISRPASEWGRPASGGGFAAGPGDGGGHDYARAAGSAFDPALSTGWTGGHGARTEHVRDYYRHTKSGGLVHVHSYYRRHH